MPCFEIPPGDGGSPIIVSDICDILRFQLVKDTEEERLNCFFESVEGGGDVYSALLRLLRESNDWPEEVFQPSEN